MANRGEEIVDCPRFVNNFFFYLGASWYDWIRRVSVWGFLYPKFFEKNYILGFFFIWDDFLFFKLVRGYIWVFI
jgi:hypothetical protein